MLYYDMNSHCCISDTEMRQRGLPPDSTAELVRLGFYPLTIEQPEYDTATQGVEPDGPPAPAPENPLAFVQRMRVFNLLERHKALKTAAVTAKRHEYEMRGISLADGTRILTGPEELSRIASVIQGVRSSGSADVNFKAASGWATFSEEQLVGLAGLISAHMQGCYTRERELCEVIDACGSLDELNAISLDEGWPQIEQAEADSIMAGSRERAAASALLGSRMQRSLAQSEVFSAAEFATLAKAGLFDPWQPGRFYPAGRRIEHDGVVYKVVNDVTAQEHQPPDAGGMLAVYRPLSVDPETGDEPDGSREHPYAWLNGMDVRNGCFYSHDGKLYQAKADMPACVWPPDTPGLWQWELAE